MSSTRTIFIDDKDTSRISYNGAWTSGGPQFKGSAQGSTTDGASATVKFKGNSVQVIGTIPEEGEEAKDSALLAIIDFLLDDVKQPSYNKPLPEENDLYSQTVFNQSFSEGEHTLVISMVTTPNLHFPPFYLDYILVSTLEETLGTKDLVHVNDNNPILNYEGSWSSGGLPTIHRTRGSSSKMVFKFNGTYINIIGSGSGSVTLDGSASPRSSSLSSGSLYEKDGLSNSEHTLALSPYSNEEISLDYILYRPSGASGNNDNGGEGNPGGPLDNKRGLSGGIIAGIIIGASIGVGLLVLAVIWFLRRSRRRQLQLSRDSSITPPGNKNMAHLNSHSRDRSEAQTPFLTPIRSPVSYSDSPVSPVPSPVTEPTLRTSLPHTSEAGPSSLVSTSPSNDPSKVEPSQPVVLSWSAPPPVMHEDGGIRLDREGDDEYQEELPPAYRPYYPSRGEH